MAAERGRPGALPLPALLASRLFRTILAAGALLCAAAFPARGQALRERLAPCLACHGETGRSENAEVPSLGGQPSAFLLIQLYVFRERQRIAEPMNELTKDLSDDDLRAFSHELAKLPAPVATAPADPGRMEKGRALSARHRCGFCHNPDFSGHDRFHASLSSGRITSLRHCGSTRARSGAATTHRWWISRASSVKPRSWTSPITWRTGADRERRELNLALAVVARDV
jgi:cytochrome c553